MRRWWGDGRYSKYSQTRRTAEAKKRELKILARRRRRRPIESFGDFEKVGDFRFCKWIEDEKFCHAPISLAQEFAYCDEHKKRALRPGGNNDDF